MTTEDAGLSDTITEEPATGAAATDGWANSQPNSANRGAVVRAIAASWSRATSETPDQWSESNRAQGHCDVSSFVAWEHLGGDLIQGQVHLRGEFQEYHYWNRLDGHDLDLTRSQFKSGEVVTEEKVLESAFLSANREVMRPELAARLSAFREEVNRRLDPNSAASAA